MMSKSPLAASEPQPGAVFKAARDIRTLVIDRQRSDRELTAAYFREAGYECQMFEHIESAFGLLLHEPIDLVAYDVETLDASSVSWLSRLEKSFPHLAVLVTTRSDDPQIGISALARGAWGYLIKPLDKAALLAQMERALDRHQLLIEHREHMRTLESRVWEQTRALHEISE